MFGKFAEMSSNVKDIVEITVEYGVKHVDVIMAAMTPDVVIMALRRKYITQLSLAAWRGYANLILDRTK